MPKFFVFSDCHGFADELKKALDESGFDPCNEDHWVIGCGDYLDRGRQPQQVIDYLMGLKRKILVRGNHEDLILECIDRERAYSHDWSNGTAQTIMDLAPESECFEEACCRAGDIVKPFISSMVDYIELENFVLCHGFIPVIIEDFLPAYYQRDRMFAKMENWREATRQQWSDARWLNGMKMVADGFGIEKMIVVGHWHSSWGRMKFEGKPEFGEGADFSPYYYQNELIAVDACTAYSGKINILVIEDIFLKGDFANG